MSSILHISSPLLNTFALIDLVSFYPGMFSAADKGTSSPLPVPCFFDVWHPEALTAD